MRAQHTIYTWDYHHGQATRVVLAGLPPLPGDSMAAKQAFFAEHLDHIRTSLMHEPRGHKNMLGAIVTDPVSADGDVGIIFLSPQGFFDMCGDSTFSAVAALVDAGLFGGPEPDGNLTLKLDTVAGRVDVHVQMHGGEPIAITFDNVPSYSLGEFPVHIGGLGQITAMVAYGGLNYAFFEARNLGIGSLIDIERDQLLELGTRVWQAARKQIVLPSASVGGTAGNSQLVDLITIWEPLSAQQGARVVNFYAPFTCGRTPSGTGLSARVAIEVAAGRLSLGEEFVHESILGLRFLARPIRTINGLSSGGTPCVVPAVTARSFLMGTSQWVLHPEDPFKHGFVF